MLTYEMIGVQDEDIAKLKCLNKEELLKNYKYYTVYEKLKYKIQKIKDFTIFIDIEPGQCDLINCLDIAIPVSDGHAISRVLVESGGHRCDSFHSWEQLVYQASLMNRYVSTHGNKQFIPLALAPLHAHNLVMPSTKYHTLQLIITFTKDVDFELYANKIFFREYSSLSKTCYWQTTIQSQYTGADRLTRGINKIKLNFNHPIMLLYFWGVKSIKHIKLIFDDKTFFDGNIEELERKKATNGFSHMKDATMIFFSNNIYKPEDSINFSKIDNAILELETEEEDEMHVVAVNTNLFFYGTDMNGLKY